jgi:hypothetical protein
VVHFLMAEDLVRDRETELRRAAARPRGVRREGTRRQRLGWMLVEAGLRLMVENSVARARRAV